MVENDLFLLTGYVEITKKYHERVYESIFAKG